MHLVADVPERTSLVGAGGHNHGGGMGGMGDGRGHGLLTSVDLRPADEVGSGRDTVSDVADQT